MYGNLEQIVNLTLSESLSLGRSINLTNRLNAEENNNSYSPSNTTGESSFYSSSPSSSASSLLSPSSSFSSSPTSPSSSPNPSLTTSPFFNSILIRPTFSPTISSPFSSPFNLQMGSHLSNVAIDSYDGNSYKDLAARSIAFYMGVYNIKIEDEVLDYLVNLILSSVAYTTSNGQNASNNSNIFMLNFQIFYWKLMELFNYENRNERGNF